MTKKLFPTYDICNLNTEKNSNELFSVDRFRGYVDSNPHLQEVHSHNYYHLVYFTEGSGEHLIDFEKFEAKSGTMYFMKPGQVHQWYFKEEYDGFVVNFFDNFFDWIGINSSILQKFRFLQSILVKDHVVEILPDLQEKIANYFEEMIQENHQDNQFSNLKIGFHLMNLFIDIERSLEAVKIKTSDYQSVLLNNFQTLIEQNFKTKKLPKEYAELLYITPNHLNALCKDILGTSAGELIRSRIVLEAKRLLVNKEISVTEIAYLLNFQDASYFVKFFKKYTEFTPEQFRKQYYS
ncbi:helix-turn-helix domain-containing protein [Empedobacter falsenii]|uniref:AraC family transcriptional regulator n=1 Tax=Empedobacter falsenii TaxID=343874 RepID=UPI002576A873|nr:helix-turn-helix transcriptional regulator [Empedobacter falsenii]MDM1299949.1 helix-turn-helix domain-containing protein [Empedobacter falsenii]MDM1319742.1 helix-turn-helix domain-containing protein [Empedobacter falsenii]